VEQLFETIGPIAAPVALVPMWVVMSLLFSVLSGWRRLADSYQIDALPADVSTSLATGRLRWVQYKNALRVGADESHFYLGTMILFRLGHPWLAIPWTHIQNDGEAGLLGLSRQCTLGVPHGGVTLKLSPERWMALLSCAPPDAVLVPPLED